MPLSITRHGLPMVTPRGLEAGCQDPGETPFTSASFDFSFPLASIRLALYVFLALLTLALPPYASKVTEFDCGHSLRRRR